ncbi:MAG TPA: cytochrome P450 [Mycobacteriales bacterium]|nr:cytochrome P450 [Mycobacteriales bacterium]
MTATIDASVFGQLLDPGLRADPYPLFARLREAGPVRIGDLPVLVLSSFGHCQAMLRDPQASVDRRRSLFGKAYQDAVAERRGSDFLEPTPSFLFLDPPDHTRLRRLVSSAFTPRMVQRLEPQVRDLVDDLLDDAAARGGLDVIADVAYPLPVAVICQLLGVPIDDEPRFHRWSSLLARSLDPVFAFSGGTDPLMDEQIEAMTSIRRYFTDLIAARRAAPGDDLLSALIAAEESGDQLTESELVSTCVLLLIAGHETTVNLIGNGMLALLREPHWLARLAGHTDLAGNLVEEVLRFDPPVQLVGRVAGADTEIGGATLRQGELGMMLIGAAHRDPAAFADPDRFDPTRGDIRHIAFGLGPHFCLGAPLARMEGRLALTRMAQRVRDPGPVQDPPPYKENVTLRGLAALPVRAAGMAGRSTAW